MTLLSWVGLARWPGNLQHQHYCELGKDTVGLRASIHEEGEGKAIPRIKLLVSTSWEHHANEIGRGNNKERIVVIHLSNLKGQGPQSHVSEKSNGVAIRIRPFEYQENEKECQVQAD